MFLHQLLRPCLITSYPYKDINQSTTAAASVVVLIRGRPYYSKSFAMQQFPNWIMCIHYLHQSIPCPREFTVKWTALEKKCFWHKRRWFVLSKWVLLCKLPNLLILDQCLPFIRIESLRPSVTERGFCGWLWVWGGSPRRLGCHRCDSVTLSTYGSASQATWKSPLHPSHKTTSQALQVDSVLTVPHANTCRSAPSKACNDWQAY